MVSLKSHHNKWLKALIILSLRKYIFEIHFVIRLEKCESIVYFLKRKSNLSLAIFSLLFSNRNKERQVRSMPRGRTRLEDTAIPNARRNCPTRRRHHLPSRSGSFQVPPEIFGQSRIRRTLSAQAWFALSLLGRQFGSGRLRHLLQAGQVRHAQHRQKNRRSLEGANQPGNICPCFNMEASKILLDHKICFLIFSCHITCNRSKQANLLT